MHIHALPVARGAINMSASAFFRIEKLKGQGRIVVAARHNRRAIQAEVGASANIDATRSHLNETLRGPETADEVAALAKKHMHEANVKPLRKDAVRCLELVFSLPPNHRVDDRAYFADCVTWAIKEFGGDQNILSADIHRDEAAPHCHVLILPLIEGCMVGSALVGDRKKLLALQSRFHTEVASRFGFKKAPDRLTGLTKQAAESAVLTKLKALADPVFRSAAWAAVRDAIQRDPGSFILALGLEAPQKPQKVRSMTQIFTSKGKGPAKEPNPIGFEARTKARTLCSVGFGPDVPLPGAMSWGAHPSSVEPHAGAAGHADA